MIKINSVILALFCIIVLENIALCADEKQTSGRPKDPTGIGVNLSYGDFFPRGLGVSAFYAAPIQFGFGYAFCGQSSSTSIFIRAERYLPVSVFKVGLTAGAGGGRAVFTKQDGFTENENRFMAFAELGAGFVIINNLHYDLGAVVFAGPIREVRLFTRLTYLFEF